MELLTRTNSGTVLQETHLVRIALLRTSPRSLS
jgi:hypothetical protein